MSIFRRLKLSSCVLLPWLWGGCVLVFLMMIIGAATRLTGSGLSMVTWRPITGLLPPLNSMDWQALFQEYQSSPEYLKVNLGMTLDEFKQIFWLEYIHRLWGRLIGLYFLVPLSIAAQHIDLRTRVFPQLLGIWLLGGLQGAVGWLMVKSGLVDHPQVSPYRLALHFMLALLTFFLIFCVAHRQRTGRSFWLDLARPHQFVLMLLTLTLFYGVLVAGHKAGLIYNTYPLMGGHWIPEDAWFLTPKIVNVVTNPAMVQWIHRWLAHVTLGALLYLILKTWRRSQTRAQKMSLIICGVLGVTQVTLGILTLLSHVSLTLALLHHFTALCLFTAVLWSTASSNALIPGSVLPSNHSRNAPPAVER